MGMLISAFSSKGKYTDINLVYGDFMSEKKKQNNPKSKKAAAMPDGCFQECCSGKKNNFFFPTYSLWLYIISTIFYFWY